MLEGRRLVECPNTVAIPDFTEGNKFQNLNVSSPAPVIILSPFGLILKNRTLYVCPIRVANLVNEG